MRPWASSSHILVFDPPAPRLGRVTEALGRKGHRISRCDGPEAILATLGGIGQGPAPDLLLMRAAGPHSGGLDLLVRVRRVSRVPVAVHGAAGAGGRERVTALELGADEHLDPHMALPEMLARLQAVLRRAAWAGPAAQPALAPRTGVLAAEQAPPIHGGWRLVPHRRALLRTPGGDPTPLTGAEFELLRLLIAAHGEPVDREAISRVVFRRPWQVEDRAVDGLVKRIRRKLGEDAIATVRGIGYALRFADPLLPASDGPAPEAALPGTVQPIHA